MREMVVELTGGPGRLALRRLEAVGEGARLAASGILLEGARIADGKFSLNVPAEGLRVAGLAPLWPDWLLRAVPAGAAVWRAPLSLEVEGAGGAGAFAAKLRGQLGDLRIEVTPTVDFIGGKWAASVVRFGFAS